MKNLIPTLIAGLIPLGLVALLLTYVAKDQEKDAPPESQPSPLRASIIEPPLEIGDFTMDSTTGEPYDYHAHDGKFRLIYFGYLTCPDFCPTTMAKFRQIYVALGEPDGLEVLFMSVDPERDSIEKIQPYVAAFHEDFIGLRTDPDQLPAILSQFGVTAVKQQVESVLNYLVDHTASIYLIDEDGHVMGRYPYETPQEDIIHDLELLL